MIFRVPGCHLGGPWAPVVAPSAHQLQHLDDIFEINSPRWLLEVLWKEKVWKRVSPGRGGYAIRTRRRMFCEGRPIRPKVVSEAVSGGHFGDFCLL